MFSPRKKPNTPVKVHLMVHRRTHSGEVEGERREEKKDDQQEEKTAHATASTLPEKREVKKTKKTPVKEALDNAVQLANQGQYQQAIQELDRAVTIHPELATNVRLHLNRGSYHFKAGMLEEALADFDRASTIDEGVASVHFNRANVLKVLNNDEEALKSFQRAAEIDPKLADAHAGVAQMLLRMRKFRQAAASASRALEIDPNHYSALDAHIKALAKLGRTIEAIDSVRSLIRWYQRLAKVDETCLTAVPAQHRRALARVLDHAAERLPFSDDRGLKLAKEAFELDQSYESCFELGNQLCARNMHLEASATFRKCAELDSTKSEAPLLEGASLIQIGDYERALPPLKRASKLMEGQKEIRFYLGLALLNLGRFSEAIPQLRRVVDSNLDDSDEILEKARFLLASAYVHAGEEKRAFELLQIARSSKRAQRDPEVHYQAGYAASLIGLDDQARACFEDCLRIDPQHSRAQEGLKNLLGKKKVLESSRPPSPPPLPPPPVIIGDKREPISQFSKISPKSSTAPPQPPPRAPQPPSLGRAPQPPKLPPPSAPFRINTTEKNPTDPPKISPSSYAKLSQLGVVSGAAAVKQLTKSGSSGSLFPPKNDQDSASGVVKENIVEPIAKSEAGGLSISSTGDHVNMIESRPVIQETVITSQASLVSAQSSGQATESIQEPTKTIDSVAHENSQQLNVGSESHSISATHSNMDGTSEEQQKIVTFHAKDNEAKAKESAPSRSEVMQKEELQSLSTSPAEPKEQVEDNTKPANPDELTSTATSTADAVVDTHNSSTPDQIAPDVAKKRAPPPLPSKRPASSMLVPKAASSAASKEAQTLNKAVPAATGTQLKRPLVNANVDSATRAASLNRLPPKAALVDTESATKLVERTDYSNSSAAQIKEDGSTLKPKQEATAEAGEEVSRSDVVEQDLSLKTKGILHRQNSVGGKLASDVQNMVNELFGPPDGSIEVVQHVTQIFVDEGMERMDDFKNLTLDDFEKIEGMKRGWCRRLYNHISERYGASNEKKGALAISPTSALQKERTNLLSGIHSFQSAQLKKVTVDKPRAIANEPASNDLMAHIKQFQRSSLRSVDSATRNVLATPGDASGFLNTILNAMRNRRVIIDDLELEGKRQQAALSEVEEDDMFEADWI